MLDQNTDRSWWTIGAIVVGGAILAVVVAGLSGDGGVFDTIIDTLMDKITGASV